MGDELGEAMVGGATACCAFASIGSLLVCAPAISACASDGYRKSSRIAEERPTLFWMSMLLSLLFCCVPLPFLCCFVAFTDEDAIIQGDKHRIKAKVEHEVQKSIEKRVEEAVAKKLANNPAPMAPPIPYAMMNPQQTYPPVYPQSQQTNVFPGPGEVLTATNDFQAGNNQQLTLTRGTQVHILQKYPNGWWFVCYVGDPSQQGYVPSVLLQ